MMNSGFRSALRTRITPLKVRATHHHEDVTGGITGDQGTNVLVVQGAKPLAAAGGWV